METKREIELFTLNTTAYEEENFQLVTDLTEEEIIEVIRPIIDRERNETDDEEEFYYDNNELVGALIEAYPNNIIKQYQDGGEDIII